MVLPSGGEARVADRSPVEADGPVRGWPFARPPEGDGRGRRAHDEAGHADHQAEPRDTLRRRRGDDGSRQASVGQTVAKPREVVRQVPGRRVPLLALLREAPFRDPSQRNRRIRRRRAEARRFLADDRRHRLRRARAREGAPARDHLVENRSEGKLVRPEIERLAERLLRRHVADRPQHDAGLRRGRNRRRLRHLARLAGRRGQLGEAEVQDLDDVLPRHHHVLGLQVAVDDSRGMRLGEPLGHLPADSQELLQRQRPGRQELAQIVPVDEFHRHPRHAVRRADVENGDDVGVAQRGGRAGLLLETLEPLLVCCEIRGKDLDRDVPAQPRVPRPVNLAHPAGADGRDNLVWTESRAGGERHEWRDLVKSPASRKPRASGFPSRLLAGTATTRRVPPPAAMPDSRRLRYTDPVEQWPSGSGRRS